MRELTRPNASPALTDTNLFRAVTIDPPRFAFSHRIIRDVVYASMLSEQKQEAHAAIARAIERGGRLSEAETLPLILNQWQRAGDRHKVFEYLDRVAELRLRQFENVSAIAQSGAFSKNREGRRHFDAPSPGSRAFRVGGS